MILLQILQHCLSEPRGGQQREPQDLDQVELVRDVSQARSPPPGPNFASTFLPQGWVIPERGRRPEPLIVEALAAAEFLRNVNVETGVRTGQSGAPEEGVS